MARSSIMGASARRSRPRAAAPRTLGPSDTSDSGSDIQGASRLKTDAEEGQLGGATPVDTDSDTDSMGTGERASAVPGRGRDDADIRPDRIARSKDALDSADPIDDDDDDPLDALAIDDLDDDDLDE
jgi:hypothetical protein